MFDPFWTFGSSWSGGIASGSAAAEAADASNRADSAQLRVRELEHRVERLALACNAMWQLLQTSTGLTDQQLKEKISQIDATDGVTDGRVPCTMVHCPSCGRQVSPRRGRCMYCGAECAASSAFAER